MFCQSRLIMAADRSEIQESRSGMLDARDESWTLANRCGVPGRRTKRWARRTLTMRLIEYAGGYRAVLKLSDRQQPSTSFADSLVGPPLLSGEKAPPSSANSAEFYKIAPLAANTYPLPARCFTLVESRSARKNISNDEITERISRIDQCSTGIPGNFSHE